MIPVDAVTALETGLLAVVEVAALAFIVIVSISAFQHMRAAIGFKDSAGNEYRSKSDRDEAQSRTTGRNAEGQTYEEWEAEENGRTGV
jgi:hypothetical protein